MRNLIPLRRVMIATGVVMWAGALAGCATGPELRLETAPDTAIANRHYGLTDDMDEKLRDRLASSLAGHEGVLAEDGWIVSAALASRPVGLGGVSDTDAREGRWTENPRTRALMGANTLHVLTIVLRDGEDGENRVVQVSAQDKEDLSPQVLTLLVEAAAMAAFEGGPATLATC